MKGETWRNCPKCALKSKIEEFKEKTICDSCTSRIAKIPNERVYRKPYDHDVWFPEGWAEKVVLAQAKHTKNAQEYEDRYQAKKRMMKK